jgi:hypothetical protein
MRDLVGSRAVSVLRVQGLAGDVTTPAQEGCAFLYEEKTLALAATFHRPFEQSQNVTDSIACLMRSATERAGRFRAIPDRGALGANEFTNYMGPIVARTRAMPDAAMDPFGRGRELLMGKTRRSSLQRSPCRRSVKKRRAGVACGG